MATQTILPDADVQTGWTEEPVGPAWSTIDEDVSGTPSDADYIETTTIDAICEVDFAASPANVSEVTALSVSLRGLVTDASSTALVEVAITHSGGTHIGASPYDVDGNDFATYGNIGDFVIGPITSLTLTKTQIDSLRVSATFKAA